MQRLLFLLFIAATLLFTSCSSTKKLSGNRKSTKQLSEKLGFQIHKKDNILLYSTAAEWLGTPYKYGGNTRKGVDCSGLVCALYNTVYHTRLERTVVNIYQKNCRKVSHAKLRPGDLVFFNTTGKKKSISHIGIYLKNDIFIHSTTSSGVRLSDLKENYYTKRWINGGKVKK